jgi:hypothetical protein
LQQAVEHWKCSRSQKKYADMVQYRSYSWVGIVIVAVLDDPVEKQKNERVLHNNNRRLREELEMEKMKNERIQREQGPQNRCS